MLFKALAGSLLLLAVACTAPGQGGTTSATAGPTDGPSTTAGPPTTGTQRAWTEVAPDPVPRSEHPAVVLDGEIVVSGGFVETGLGDDTVTDAVGVYDPAGDAWSELPPMPEPRHHGMAAVFDGRLFVIGGYSHTGFNPTSTHWELVDGEWVDRARLPVAVGAGAAVVHDGSIYLVGGTPNGRFFRYDPGTDTWEHLNDPELQREHLAAVVVDDEIWALAGRWDGEIYDSTEIYDPSTGEWRPGPSFNEARSGFGAAVIDGAIYAVGGEVFDPNLALDSMEILINGEWTVTDPLPYGIHGHPLVEIDGSLYLPGGSTQPAGVENDGRTFIYN